MTHELSPLHARRPRLRVLRRPAAEPRFGPHPPADMQPLIGAGFRPTDEDERGLWQQYERFEEEVAGSNLLIQDPRLTSYVGGLMERVGGPAARDPGSMSPTSPSSTPS